MPAPNVTARKDAKGPEPGAAGSPGRHARTTRARGGGPAAGASGALGSLLWQHDSVRVAFLKVLPCTCTAAHGWASCPFAHPGEKVRRRPPGSHGAEMCTAARQGRSCPLGDSCPQAHNVFEVYLHPHMYKTKMCTDGAACQRKVCFFAHTSEELRTPGTPLPPLPPGCPLPPLPVSTTPAAAAAQPPLQPQSQPQPQAQQQPQPQPAPCAGALGPAAAAVLGGAQAVLLGGRVYVVIPPDAAAAAPALDASAPPSLQLLSQLSGGALLAQAESAPVTAAPASDLHGITAGTGSLLRSFSGTLLPGPPKCYNAAAATAGRGGVATTPLSAPKCLGAGASAGTGAGALLELLREASESNHTAAAAQLAAARARAAASEAADRAAVLAARLALQLRAPPAGCGASLSEPLTTLFAPMADALAGSASAPWPAAVGSEAASLDAAVAAGLLQLSAGGSGIVDAPAAPLMQMGDWAAECL